MAKRVSREEFEHLCRMIQRWNENRLELFEITLPAYENLEFEGIMRFYFQSLGADGQKVATKCIRVSNTATTEMVIEALVQKFRPDMRMLTHQSSYALYEVHSDEGERKLDKSEHPLLVQLNWAKGQREGRFLLRREPLEFGSKGIFRKSPKKEKKVPKKKKGKKEKPPAVELNRDDETPGSIARSLYSDMPESRFTRSISVKNKKNLVVGKRRISYHGEEFDSDGTVRVYADSVLPDVPCKSLLISAKDTAMQVVKSALDKYGLREDPNDFCLVQVAMPPASHFSSDPQLNVEYMERILADGDCPLQVHSNWGAVNGPSATVQFQLRRRASFVHRHRESHSRSRSPEDDPTLPALVEIFQGAQSPPQSPRRFFLSPESTEIGSNVALLDPKSYICLTSGGIKPRHCVISSIQGFFKISPLDKAAMIFINKKRVIEPTFLPHNAELKLGDREMFRFFAPVEMKQSSSSMHTLPINIGRPSGGHGIHRQELIPTKSENISKAYSVEDLLNPSLSQHRAMVPGKLKDKAYSEYNLKADGSYSSGYRRVQRKYSEPSFIPEEGSVPPGSKHSDAFPMRRKRHYSSPQAGGEPEGVVEWILPASLSFYQAQENLLLQNMVSEVNGYLMQFKLAPAYGLYMVVKHHLSPDFQPSSSSTDRRKYLVLALKNIVAQIKRAVKESRNIAGSLAFWLANTSEFLHFLKHDQQVTLYTSDYENVLTQIVHTAYKNFTQCMLKELNMFLLAFLDDSSEADSEEGYISDGEGGEIGKEPDVVPVKRPSITRQTSMTGMYWSVAGSKIRRRGRPTIGDVLSTLSSTVSILKRCRVNATLSVMIFSLLFRYISTKVFNKLLLEAKCCTRSVGQKLRRRLDRVKVWAEKEGMELPAEDHLNMVIQAANLLQASKKLPSAQDAQNVFATCSKLNSQQVTTLLHNCSLSEGEVAVNPAFASELIDLAQTHRDEALQNDGLEINLEEDPNLELPFLIPQQGYSCDNIIGVPPGLQDYFEPMISAGLCKMTVTKDSAGNWAPPAKIMTSAQSLDKPLSPRHSDSNPNVSATLPRMAGHSHKPSETEARGLATLPRHLEYPPEIKIIHVTLTKEHGSLGISIIGGKNSATHGDLGIFVKSMVEAGVAYQDGTLKSGDQILSVDGISLEGCTQEQAAHILRGTGKTVSLVVAKQAAVYYGLTHLIHQPSPRYSRKHNPHQASSHAHKAMRRQKREQREKQRQERYQHHEFRLERRKLPEHNQTEPSHLPPSHSPNPSLVPDSRFPSATNPQFTKWIMEHSVFYNAEKGIGSEVDIQSSMSSLTNIPERDRPGPGSPVPSYTTSSTHPRREDYSDRGFYRPSSPPVKDTGPSRAANFQSSFFTFDALESSTALDAHTVSETPSKFSDYSAAEPEHPLLPTPSSNSRPFMLSSQQTLSSQQMLTPYSQQQNPSQQQHLDKLSMDVMYHTQLSGASMQGITAMIPTLDKSSGSKSGRPHLDHSDLKELEMDEIDLEKQRIQLMLYEQQKQKEQTNQEQNVQNRPGQVASTFQKEYGQSDTVMQYANNPHANGDDSDMFPEPDSSIVQLRQELQSLDQIVSDQRKKYRELKFAREREEQNLKQAEMKFREHELTNGMFGLNPTDQHRWQKEQKRRLRELERIRADQNERLQKIEYSEHRAKTKLKAYEAQANEIRQQLQKAEGAQTVGLTTPTHATFKSRGSESYHPDMLPSKLTSNQRNKVGGGISRDEPQIDVEQMLPQQETRLARERHHSVTTPAEREWADTSRSTPARVMSSETVSTSIWVGNEQPDLAKEALNTISESNLTEPTQDDPSPVKWNSGHPYKLSHDPHKLMQRDELYSTDSKVTLTTEQDEQQFSQEERFQGLKEEQVQSMVSVDNVPCKAAEEEDLHTTRLQQEVKQKVYPDIRQQEFVHRQNRVPAGTEKQENRARDAGVPHPHPYSHSPHPTSAEPWRQPTSSAWNDHLRQPQAHQYPGRSGYHNPRQNRSRGYPHNQMSNATTSNPMPSSHERPVQDRSRLLPAPDVVPASGTISPRLQNPQGPQTQHNPAERSISPLSRHSEYPAPQSPTYLPPHHTVPFQRDREKIPSMSHPSSIISPHPRQEYEHLPTRSLADRSKLAAVTYNQSYYATPRPVSTTASSHSSHDTVRSSVGMRGASKPIPYVKARPDEPVYDVPYESTHVPQPQSHTYALPRAQNAPERDNYPLVKTNTATPVHRYAPSREGKHSMGHSYIRGRPELVHFTSFEDQIKTCMDRSYKGQAPRHPERIQRQQTEL